ncbi:MAG TPA: D-Ala-D-Ala carboxypeptidase family metallohydrolase [Vicinamibacterales bacterium]|nr:D-Ala-D-Ala carboxypeptidase family metallohydrolase [Vicinamibacterales bacterium]
MLRARKATAEEVTDEHALDGRHEFRERTMTRHALILVTVALLHFTGRAGAAARFDTKTASFALTFHDEASAYRDATVVMSPGASVVVNAIGGPPGDFTATTGDGTLVQQGIRQWKWTVPVRPGTYSVTVTGPGKKDAIALHAFVIVPASEVRNGLLNGYRIGEYPAARLTGNPVYAPPPGYIEVTRDNEDTRVSPHFTLEQFLCKEDTTKQYPKYVVLNERLPMKLEMVLEHINGMGFAADTLHVMSAYRTPYYNHAIGDVQYSMHQWGSAADIYVDPQNRNRMEDLNHDGRVDAGDAKQLYDEIERLLVRPEYRKFQGGMGFYPATAAHPPFVHVDVRGTAARWKG